MGIRACTHEELRVRGRIYVANICDAVRKAAKREHAFRALVVRATSPVHCSRMHDGRLVGRFACAFRMRVDSDELRGFCEENSPVPYILYIVFFLLLVWLFKSIYSICIKHMHIYKCLHPNKKKQNVCACAPLYCKYTTL